jgi:hypothetical protein
MRLARSERGDLLIQTIIGLVITSAVALAGVGIFTAAGNSARSDATAFQDFMLRAASVAQISANGTTVTVAPSGSGSVLTLYRGRTINNGSLGPPVANLTTASKFLLESDAGSGASSYSLTWNPTGLLIPCTTAVTIEQVTVRGATIQSQLPCGD